MRSRTLRRLRLLFVRSLALLATGSEPCSHLFFGPLTIAAPMIIAPMPLSGHFFGRVTT